MYRHAPIAVLAVAILAASDASAQGDLRKIRDALHPGPKFILPEAGSRDSGSKWFGIDPAYQNAAAGASVGPAAIGLGVVGVAVATSPLWGPHELFDAGFEHRGWFPPHPHMADDRPYMVIGNCTDVALDSDDYFSPLHVKPWSLRLAVDVGDDFDSMSRFGGHLFLDTSIHRLGFLANVNYFREELILGREDDAVMTDFNLTWRVTQSASVLMHLGAGVRTWTYDGETDAGINGLYRADWFPVNQIHLSALFEAGSLREQLVLHGQIQAGFMFSHGEIFLGYDLLRIKNVNLQGPSAGIRLWF